MTGGGGRGSVEPPPDWEQRCQLMAQLCDWLQPQQHCSVYRRLVMWWGRRAQAAEVRAHTHTPDACVLRLWGGRRQTQKPVAGDDPFVAGHGLHSNKQQKETLTEEAAPGEPHPSAVHYESATYFHKWPSPRPHVTISHFLTSFQKPGSPAKVHRTRD